MIDLMGFSNVSIFQRFPSINVMMQSKGKDCVSIALILTLTITTALQRDAKNVISDITLFYMIPLLAIQELKSPISWKPSGSWKKSLQLFLSLLSVLGLKHTTKKIPSGMKMVVSKCPYLARIHLPPLVIQGLKL
ncbi:uncharacterized protein LOC120350435 [Nilaparvata lugens]|uniref:uncharacterized protein LOC120350435 n=1 Tax=Nilaparvata lugens TaxID=108931 RepID=UPI00193DC25F|nr:uncharacterized protein LOC120350435 [Nilaparvata lugens]